MLTDAYECPNVLLNGDENAKIWLIESGLNAQMFAFSGMYLSPIGRHFNSKRRARGTQ